MQAVAQMKGFSLRNLKYIRQWHVFWQAAPIGQQAVAQLVAIPWRDKIQHSFKIDSCSRLFYKG
ncbi:DUF1016 domain-containing protein [Acidovorax sp. HDW3]|nr:DUF1016 domain-containing protein [Acidovorax sp. HDW3]